MHDAPIRCVEFCPDANVIVTGSWDSTVKLWDPRTPCNAGTFSQPDKVGGFAPCLKVYLFFQLQLKFSLCTSSYLYGRYDLKYNGNSFKVIDYTKEN